MSAWASRVAAIDERRFRGLCLGLFVFAALLRLVYVAEIKDSAFVTVLVGDAFSYDAWARAIAQDWIGKEVFYQAPLYPYFLAAVYGVLGSGPLAVRIVQALIGAAACVCLAAAGRRWWSPAVGLGAGLLLAIYGPMLFFTGVLQKTTLDLFFTTALLWALSRLEAAATWRALGVCGAALGCLTLTRENALAWFPLLALWIAWRHRPRAIVPFLLGGLLVLGPVAARNAVVGGEFVLTTSQFGVNFYLGNNATADGRYTPLRYGHGSFAQERADAIALAQEAAGRALTPGEVSQHWAGRAWDWIGENPGAWIKLLAHKWLLVWSDEEIADSDQPLVYQDASWTLRGLWSLLSFGWLCPFAAVGAMAAWPQRRRLGLLYVLLLGAAASTAWFFVFARYRAPMTPLLMLFAAVGVAHLAAMVPVWLRDSRWRALAGPAAALLLAWWGSHAVAREDQHPRATAYYNLAVTLESQGDDAQAIVSYRSALANDRDFQQAFVNLGAALARTGDLDGAIAAERAALRLRPDDAMAHTNLGNALLESGKLAEAEGHFGAALRVAPDFQAARDGLSMVRDLRERRRTP